MTRPRHTRLDWFAFDRRHVLGALAGVVFLVVLAIVLRATGFGTAFDEAWIEHRVRGEGARGAWLFVGVGAVLASVAFPRQLISLLAGYAFGFSHGVLLGVGATLGGAILTYLGARFAGRWLHERLRRGRWRAIHAFIHTHPFSMTLLIRLLPVGLNFVTNLVAGAARIAPLPFFSATTLGYLPQTAVFALIGSGIAVDPWSRGALALGLFIGAIALGAWLWRRFRRLHADEIARTRRV
jgi:uncharacterized membrane protein YdjX (TVP38/TMEM64 family)